MKKTRKSGPKEIEEENERIDKEEKEEPEDEKMADQEVEKRQSDTTLSD
jgi:hypothetical protein